MNFNQHLAYFISLFAVIVCAVTGVELTFELEDNSKQCFFEEIEKGNKVNVEYQVVSGGRYDVDCTIEDADGLKIYSEKRKQYDSYNWETQKGGAYQICFSNEFSTITHKVVYFDLVVGEDKPLIDSMDKSTALSLMETACSKIHEGLKQVINFQKHFQRREYQGRGFAEDLNTRVQIWSVAQIVIMMLVVIGQIYVLRSFFAHHKSSTRSDT